MKRRTAGCAIRVRLAPAYDVMSTTYYPNVSTRPAMFVNGVRDITAITRDDLIAEAVSWGRPEDVTAERVDELLVRAEEASENAARETNPPDELLDAVGVRVRSFAAPAHAATIT